MIIGTVAIFIAPDGHVVASATSFEPDAMHGATQEGRAKDRLYRAVAHEMCNPSFAKACTGFALDSVMQAMQRDGYRVETIKIEARAA